MKKEETGIIATIAILLVVIGVGYYYFTRIPVKPYTPIVTETHIDVASTTPKTVYCPKTNPNCKI